MTDTENSPEAAAFLQLLAVRAPAKAIADYARVIEVADLCRHAGSAAYVNPARVGAMHAIRHADFEDLKVQQAAYTARRAIEETARIYKVTI